MKDQKLALWSKFEETYPNGMRKTAFMTRLANCTHIRYRSDLGGLCITCNDYGYDVFEDLLILAKQTFLQKELLVS